MYICRVIPRWQTNRKCFRFDEINESGPHTLVLPGSLGARNPKKAKEMISLNETRKQESVYVPPMVESIIVRCEQTILSETGGGSDMPWDD